jgi:hypothetical protein
VVSNIDGGTVVEGEDVVRCLARCTLTLLIYPSTLLMDRHAASSTPASASSMTIFTVIHHFLLLRVIDTNTSRCFRKCPPCLHDLEPIRDFRWRTFPSVSPQVIYVGLIFTILVTSTPTMLDLTLVFTGTWSVITHTVTVDIYLPSVEFRTRSNRDIPSGPARPVLDVFQSKRYPQL